MFRANLCHRFLLGLVDLQIFSLVRLVIKRAFTGLIVCVNTWRSSSLAVEVVIHLLCDVFPTVIAEHGVTFGTDDFIATIFFKNPDLAFPTRSDQSFGSSLFNDTALTDAIFLFEFVAGQRYV